MIRSFWLKGVSLHYITDKNKRRILLVLDLLAMVCAYLLAMWVRFAFALVPWQMQLYRTMLLFAVFTDVFLYTYRHVRGHFYSIEEMDLLENLARVIRDKFFVYVLLILFFALTKNMGSISRKFLLLMIIFDVTVDYLFRIIYREILLNTMEEKQAADRFLLVTTERMAAVAAARLRDGLSGKAGASLIAGIALMPESSAGSDTGDMPGREEPLRHLKAGDAVQGIRILGSAADILGEENGGKMADHPDGNTEGTQAGSFGNGSYNRVYVYLPDTDSGSVRWVLERCDAAGLMADVALTIHGDVIPRKMIHAGAGTQESGGGEHEYNYAVAEYTNMKTRCRVLGVNFAVTNAEAAARFVLNHLCSLQGRYICFCNVHTTVMAREDQSYCAIQNHSAYTFADGAPIAAVERYQGFPGVERCAGPDFMDAVFRATMDGSVGHYFYGSTPETVELLREKLEKRYPGIRICGVYSPPFRKLEETAEEEDQADIRRINESGAEIVWIGLGAPKQERWMAVHEGKLNGTMFGVGAGFNFYAGNVKRAPKWMQRMGLEWLYRLFQDPKRLFNRYFVTNLKFVWYLIADSVKRR